MGFNAMGAWQPIQLLERSAPLWEAEIFGRASHAGVAPARGISATMVPGGSAGVATNVVTDYERVVGVSRNHDAEFVTERSALLPPKLLNASAQ